MASVIQAVGVVGVAGVLVTVVVLALISFWKSRHPKQTMTPATSRLAMAGHAHGHQTTAQHDQAATAIRTVSPGPLG
ncbi:hypothetical protein ACQP2C_32120 [Micromonospora zamorensis]|uniref:hypothetical protein n=1 Tax=Micromonospora zamorensis TaxID=709883 RepID=UPI003D95C55F